MAACVNVRHCLCLEHMNRSTFGFTIVELLIVIMVLGILVSIGVVGWASVITSSKDQTRASDTNEWISTFDLYKGRYFVWPALPTDTTPKAICLGKPTSGGNPKVFLNKCVQYNGTVEFNGTLGTFGSTTSTDYTSFTGEVAKIGNLKENNGPTINNISYAGPFVFLWQTTAADNVTVTVYAHFINFFERACPAGYTRITTSPAPVLPSASIVTPVPPASYLTLFTSTPTIPSSAYACFVPKSFTYTKG
jgi:prepilin-type N-terminal cleavage/methylation domain-containing protein